VGPEGIKEKSGDDISLISVLLKDFSTAHVEAVRYLVERAGSDPSVLRALTNVVRAMRGE
jgi:hypothetical protein